MSYFDAVSAKAHAQAIQGDMIARIADFLARKSQEVPGRFEALYRSIEKKIQSVGLRKTLRSLVAQFQGSAAAREGLRSLDPLADPEWEHLVEQIQAYRLDKTIENYSEYLFSMEGFDVKSPW